MLYDLTNTYFKGDKRNSKLAQFGRSKEKRSDAKLVVLALVVNMYGFIKYSSIHEGNFSDTAEIETVINNLDYAQGSTKNTKDKNIVSYKGNYHVAVNTNNI